MDSKISSLIIVIIGAALLLASVFAESIGLGDDPGFGRQQTAGTIAGVVILVVGGYLYTRDSGDRGSAGEPTDSP